MKIQKFQTWKNFLQDKKRTKNLTKTRDFRLLHSVIQTRHKANTDYQTSVDDVGPLDIARRYIKRGTTANRAQRR